MKREGAKGRGACPVEEKTLGWKKLSLQHFMLIPVRQQNTHNLQKGKQRNDDRSECKEREREGEGTREREIARAKGAKSWCGEGGDRGTRELSKQNIYAPQLQSRRAINVEQHQANVLLLLYPLLFRSSFPLALFPAMLCKKCTTTAATSTNNADAIMSSSSCY